MYIDSTAQRNGFSNPLILLAQHIPHLLYSSYEVIFRLGDFVVKLLWNLLAQTRVGDLDAVCVWSTTPTMPCHWPWAGINVSHWPQHMGTKVSPPLVLDITLYILGRLGWGQ